MRSSLSCPPRADGQPRIAVLIPCYNEEPTIGQVVADFQATLPEATIFVFDNNSSDATAEVARRAGATVAFEGRRGKGFVVQSMFRKVDADIYILIDGDGTYPVDAVHRLLEPVLAGDADMLIGSRLTADARSQFRWLNRFGNLLYLRVLNRIFGVRLTDLLSGYRVFNRRLVRGVPLFGGGFETETELTIKALELGFSVAEVPVELGVRPPGSFSKIRIVQDGWLILRTILTLCRDYRPLTFFGALGLGIMALAIPPGAWVISAYLETGLVERLPSAVLAVGLVLLGSLFVVLGLLLHTISRRFQELTWQLQTFADESRESPPTSNASERGGS